MSVRLKTIECWFPELETFVDNTDTNFNQITVYLPESGTKIFRSITLEVMWQDAATVAANTARRQVSLQLGAAGYSVVNNTNLLTNSGENYWLDMSADFTAYFNTNWGGTSMTCDARILVDSAAATPILRCATAKLTITYEYDDTATTHVKTVRLPLDAPRIALATSKPAVIATIPALDTWLPEAGKVIRQITIIIQGNEEHAATTDSSISMEIDSLGARTTQLHEHARNSACWYRHVWQPSFTTSVSHLFYIWASLADYDHPQIWMVITYEFTSADSTTIMNSLLLPMEFDSPMGGPTATDWQRASRDLWIEEPATITLQDSALFIHYDQAAAISGLGARVGTGSFLTFSSVAAMVCGGCGAMIRAETPIGSLSRGKNTISADIYRTDSSDLGWNVSGWWIINYTSGKATAGVGAHNHTVCWNLFCHNTTAADNNRTTSAWAPDIPEALFFINAMGLNYQYLTNTSGNAGGVVVQVERLAAEGGIKWETFYSDICHTDPEVGIRQCWATARKVFKRWPNDADTDRIAVQTARRYKAYLTQGANSWDDLDLWFTYHTIIYTIAGLVSDSGGGTVYLKLVRDSDDQVVLETSRVGDGAYSFTWYDNTADMYVDAYEDSTHVGRSALGVAT